MSTHPIVHIEISTGDREVSGKFYADLFGWNVQQIPDMHYATFETGEGVGGGFNPVNDTYPLGTTVVYVGCDDLDGSLAAAVKLGGTSLVPPTEIPGMGWFALIADPFGNKIGLFKSVPMG